MKKKEINIELNKAGVDQASETVSGWLEEAGRILSKQKHICRRMLFA